MSQLTSTSCARSWVIACALVSLLAPLSAHAADCRMSGNDLTNDHNQPDETLIDIRNVATLKPAWSFRTLGSVSATPLVSGGYVYVPDWGGGLQRANSTEGEQCLAFIETSRPGGDASVPYGDVFQTLKEAQQDALNRCSLTNLVQEGWGPCQTWCVKAN
jgi:hypothetical protein